MWICPVRLSLYTIKKQIAPWVCWLLVMLMLAPMGQHAVGAVLCIEADGTVTLEKATGFACGSQVGAAEQHETDAVTPADTKPTSHCGSCIDVVLPGEADADCASFLLSRVPTALVDLPVVVVISSSVMASDAEIMPVRHDPIDEHVSSSLTPLRSVILLI
jgi:hypothetical protein